MPGKITITQMLLLEIIGLNEIHTKEAFSH